MDHPVGDLSTPLSVAMREGSRREHEQAEGTDFVSDLLAGRAHPHQYAAYLARLRDVYAALEQAVRDHRDDPVVTQVYDETLCRLDALDADLEFWSGPDRSTGSPAADRYRERIDRARRTPLLLVAHHYTRYLGDLSGGRMLAQAMRRGYEGLDRGGLAFYEFDAIPKPVAYKRAYRDRLDGLRLSPSQRTAMVEEVRSAFRLNHALLDEVATLGAGCVTPRCPG
ncbi:biliverdin-producing heme oxygenase [Nocardioides koreensis]|uniref:heme oxygenase (biliverdin-producing) n=1 Tax=Nocardioides koreensis TaxID=433651 RepID=A0ABP5LJG3_9ACTN